MKFVFVGDLGSAFGPRMYQIFSQPYIMQLLQEARGYEDLHTIVNWTSGVVQQIRAGKHP